MSVFKRNGQFVSKFQLHGRQHWTPGGPWPGTREGQRQAKEAERRHRDRLNARRTEETCASFADRWLAEWPRPAASTRALYAQAVNRFAEHFGPTALDEVERLSARSWALGVPRNLSKIVATMYEDARNIGVVETNPFSNLRLPKTEKTEEVHPPTLEEYRTLLRSCVLLGGYGAEFRALIQFTAWTGLRVSEVQGLQWRDIDGDLIHVRRALKDDGSYGKPKNGLERTIALLEPARVLDHVPRREGSPFVFHVMKGAPLNQANLYYHWNKVRAPLNLERQEAGLPGVRFHDLRHFCATQLLELGLSHFDVSIQLGHEDGGALVMSRYGHPSKDAARSRLLAVFSGDSATSRSSTGSGAAATPHGSGR
jgi:integrase